MKLSLENLDTAPVVEDIEDVDVLAMIAQSEEVSELALSIEGLLFNGEKLDEVSGNIYGVITMLEKEALTAASFEFLNMDGALDALVGKQLTFTEEARKELTDAALESLKENVKKGYDAVVRWFKALWDWIVQLLRKAIDLFISNDKILARMEKDVKGGKFYGAPATKISGVNAGEFAKEFKAFTDEAGKLEGNDKITDNDVSGLGNMLNKMIAGVKESVTAESAGWTDAAKVEACIAEARRFIQAIKAKGDSNKLIKDKMALAITAAKAAGAGKEDTSKQKEDITAAKKVAALQGKVVALRVRGLKFGISQAIAMGRHFRKGGAAPAAAAAAEEKKA